MIELQVVTFCDQELGEENALLVSCREKGLPLHVLKPEGSWTCNAIKLRLLWSFVNSKLLNDDCLLLVSDAFDVLISQNKEKIIELYNEFDADIVFSAEANYYFRNPDLSYFYWKHYPRQNTPYNFLNSGNYIGSVDTIRKLLFAIFEEYEVNPGDLAQLKSIRSDQYLLSRFYVDNFYSANKYSFSIELDHQQSLFACTAGRMFATENIPSHWIECFYYFRYQRFIFKYLKLQNLQIRCVDIRFHQGKLKNIHTDTNPAILHIAGSRNTFGKAIAYLENNNRRNINGIISIVGVVVNKISLVAARCTRKLIEYVNGGEYTVEQLFRYRAQKNPEYIEAGEKIVSRIEKKLPVAFAHFNDGEIDFVSHYVGNKKSELWTGRRQHKYEPILGEALHKAMTYASPHYFRGIPCSLCHPNLQRVAEEIVGMEDTVIPAMTIHHNLALMPRLLMALKGRELWFIANPRQDLNFFENMGLEVRPERVFRVPFQNSHQEYDRFKSMKFAEDAVVITTCGMLGKILMPIWIKNNPCSSFLALGSSLDDHIQNQYQFKLFPKVLPMTKNIYGSKPFLFGPKKHCPECYPGSV